MAIITADDLRAALTQIPDTTEYDVKVDAAVNAANPIVERELSPVIFAVYPDDPEFRMVYGNDTSWLLLPAYKTGSLVEVRTGSATGTVVDATSYTTEGQSLRLLSSTSFPTSWPYYYPHPAGLPRWGYGPYYVSARWGYGAAPADIVQVALEVAINIYQTTESGGIRQYESVEGDTVVLQTTGLSSRQRAIIANVKGQYLGSLIA